MAQMCTSGTSLTSHSTLAASNEALSSQPTVAMRRELLCEPPSGADLDLLAARFNAWLDAARRRENREAHSWFNFFTDIDADSSGIITFDEWRHAIRSRLGIGKRELSEEQLKGVWCALDANDSDSATPTELGAFLKRTVATKDAPVFNRQATISTSGTSLTSASALAASSSAVASQPTAEMRAELEASGVVIALRA